MNLVNGVENEPISAQDRGLAYGDGVFRTFPVRGGRPLLWLQQYAKLAADCESLRIACPAAAVFERDLAAISTRKPDCVVKIIVTRGSAARGYAIPEAAAPTRIVTASLPVEYPRDYYESGVRVHLCRIRLAPQPVLAGIKHLNRLENVLGRSEWNDSRIAEGVMCDVEDNVIGGTMTNLFLVRGDTLVTPDLARCGVAGVTRELVLELARSNKIPTRIASFSLDDLLDAEELFLVNSVIGVWQITGLGRKSWNAGPLTAQVRRWLDHVQDS